MTWNKDKSKSIGSFILAIGFLTILSLIFFPRHDWVSSETVNAKIHKIGISQSKYGSSPFYIVDLANGKRVRVKAPSTSPYLPGDKVGILVYTCAKKSTHKRYGLSP